jgi:hypothetical protein
VKKSLILFVAVLSVCFCTSYAQDLNSDGRTDILESVDQNRVERADTLASGGMRAGAILVDTGHGEYMSTSSCSILFSNLAGQGFTATDFSGTIDAAALAGIDVLCIGTPRGNQGAFFSNTEISAIVAFVQQGGGLMISGDYYNPPYSDNVKSNSIANNFGILYNQDKPSPNTPLITSFTNHEINNGVSSIEYHGWCTTNLSGSAQSIADYTGIGMAEVVEHGSGRVFSIHDWNIYSDGFVNDVDNLAWATQGIIWAAGGGGPTVDIKCNGGDAGVSVPVGTNVTLDFDVNPAGATGLPIDIWILTNSPFGWFCYTGLGPMAGWNSGFGSAYFTGPAAMVSGTALNQPLPVGSYKSFIGIDAVPNGVLDLGAVVISDMVDFQVY